MTFYEKAMLLGLIAVFIPILIHLLNRRKAKLVDWGAMRFLLEALAAQNRRIMLEEMLLLILRCLLFGLLALAMARPLLPSDSTVPWPLVLPAVIVAAVCAAVAVSLWDKRRVRWPMLFVAAALVGLSAIAAIKEHLHQSTLWRSSGEKDIAIVIDGSMSMALAVDGRSNFERALDEARGVIRSMRPADAACVILASEGAQRVTGGPISNKKELLQSLGDLKPTAGSMRVLEALNAAGVALAEGKNLDKKIVLITDGQDVGWDLLSQGRWAYLAARLKELPTVPKIICRQLAMPKSFTNVAVTEMTVSRRVIGTDRPVRIEVKVTNTGSVAVKPSSVELTIDGGSRMIEAAGEIQPNAAEMVRFGHTFARPGRHVVTAKVVCKGDELPVDDASDRVVDVMEKLPVLIVDGAPSERALDGAAAFIELALAPMALPDEEDKEEDHLSPEERERRRRGRKKPPEPDFLVVTTVVGAPDIGTIQNVRDYVVVVLANVPMLPAEFAAKLADFAQRGGGLLVAPGNLAKPDFYNNWTTSAGVPVLPAKLPEQRRVSRDGVALSAKTFTHPALEVLTEKNRVEGARIRALWELQPDERKADVSVGGRTDDGSPFLVERKLGRGFVVMTAVSLDHHDSNLPMLRPCFLPMIHELTYYLAAATLEEANLRPGTPMVLDFGMRLGAPGRGSGLKGEYFSGHDLRELKLTRVDPTVDFTWKREAPSPDLPDDRFSVRWTGQVRPRYSDKYTFHVMADDAVRLWVDGRPVINDWNRLSDDRAKERTSEEVRLEAYKKYDVKLEYYEYRLDASVSLMWSSDRQPREVIPRSRLFPPPAMTAAAYKADALPGGLGEKDVLDVVTPALRRAPGTLSWQDGSFRLTFDRTSSPGLYCMLLPPELQGFVSDRVTKRGVPFVVVGEGGESRLTTLTDLDVASLRPHVDIFRAETPEDVASVLTGEVPGQEVWHYLAAAVVLIVLGEIALTRWMAMKRRIHGALVVDFGAEAIDVDQFRMRAKKLLAVEQNEQREPQTVVES